VRSLSLPETRVFASCQFRRPRIWTRGKSCEHDFHCRKQRTGPLVRSQHWTNRTEFYLYCTARRITVVHNLFPERGRTKITLHAISISGQLKLSCLQTNGTNRDSRRPVQCYLECFVAKATAFWDMAPYSLIEVARRFRDTASFIRTSIIALMMEAETPLKRRSASTRLKWRSVPEGSYSYLPPWEPEISLRFIIGDRRITYNLAVEFCLKTYEHEGEVDASKVTLSDEAIWYFSGTENNRNYGILCEFCSTDTRGSPKVNVLRVVRITTELTMLVFWVGKTASWWVPAFRRKMLPWSWTRRYTPLQHWHLHRRENNPLKPSGIYEYINHRLLHSITLHFVFMDLVRFSV
jgi:hypothetical protein